MTLQEQLSQAPFYAYSIDKITGIHHRIADRDFFYFNLFLQKFPKTELHFQPFERKQGIICLRFYGRHIGYQEIERKAQIEASHPDVQAGRFGCHSGRLIYGKSLNGRQI